MTTVFITEVTEPDELYRRDGWAGLQTPQLALDLSDGELSCTTQSGNAVPGSVWNRRVQWFQLPCLAAKAANRFMAAIAPLAQEVVNGASEHWNGTCSTWFLSEEAEKAALELTELCSPESNQWDPTDMVGAYGARDWFIDGDTDTVKYFGITASTTDVEIDAMEASELAVATQSSNDGYVILTGVAEYLRDLRDELIQEGK